MTDRLASSVRSPRRALVGVVVSAVLATGLSAATSVAPAAATGEPPEVGVHLSSAAWFELPPENKAGAVPRSWIDIAPGGAAVWGAQVVAGAERLGDDGPVSLRFTGFPAGVDFGSAAGVPLHVASEDKVRVTGCSRSGADVDCQLEGQVAPGELAIAGVQVAAAGSAPVGEYRGSVEVREGDGSVSPATPLTVAIAVGVRDSLFVTTGAAEMAVVGQVEARTLHVFNLGGAGKRDRKLTIKLGNVVPAKLASKAMAKGKGWSCTRKGSGLGSCSWRGSGPGVGQATTPLRVSFVPHSKARRGIREQGGAHTFNWLMKVGGSRYVQPAKHRETVHLAAENLVKPTPRAKPRRGEGNLSVTASVLGKPIIGGIGRYRVAVNNGGGHAVRGGKLQITPPGHARIHRFESARGWRCSKNGVCTLQRSVPSHAGVPPILFSVKSNPRLGRKATRQHLTVTSSWAGKGSARMRRHRVVVDDNWAPALGLSLRTMSKKLHSGEHGSIGNLHAEVSNLNGRSVIFDWRQICRGRCGKLAVSWDKNPAGTTQHAVLSQGFRPPKVKKRTKLTFELRVSVGGASVAKRVSVQVSPFHNRVDPRLRTSQWRRSIPTAVDRGPVSRVRAKALGRAMIGKRGSSIVRPGQKVSLRVNVKSLGKTKTAGVSRIQWLLDGQPPTRFAKVRILDQGRLLTFKVPKRASAPSTHVLSAIVHHKRGRSTAVSEMIHVVKPASSRIAAPADAAPRVLGTSARSGSTFCELYQAAGAATLTSLSFGSVTMGLASASTTGSSCTDSAASIGLTGGQLTVNGVGLTNVAATITSTGLTLNSGTVHLPTDNPAIPAALTTFNFTAGSEPLIVAFLEGELSNLQGSIPLSSMPFLALPAGLSLVSTAATPSQISFGPTSSGGYEVMLTAYASGPNDASASLIGGINTDGSYTLTLQAANVLPITGVGGSTAVFTGGISLQHIAGQPTSYSGALGMVTKGAVFQLYGGFSIKQASLCLGYFANNTCSGTASTGTYGLQLSATGLAALGGGQQNVALTGTITDLYNWNLNATTDYTITFANGSISNLGGGIAMTRATPTAVPQLAIDVTADATIANLKLVALKLTVTPPVKAHFGIYCNNIPEQPAGTDKACKNQTTQLQLDITGSLDLTAFGHTGSIPVQATVNADPATMDFNFQAAVSGSTGFGPAELNMSGLEFFATDQPSLAPQLVGNPCMTDATMASQEMVYGATGQISVKNGFTGNVTLVYNSAAPNAEGFAGICIAGTIAKDQVMAMVDPAWGSFANDETGAVFVYSSWATTLAINEVQTNVSASVFTLVADYSVPLSVSEWLGLESSFGFQGILTFGADITSFKLTANYLFPSTGGFIIGGPESSGTTLKAQTVGLSIGKIAGTWAFGASVQFALNTEGSPGAKPGQTTITTDNVIAPSGEIPLTGTFAFSPASGAAGALVSFGLRLGSSGEPTTIKDFLGFSGLNVMNFQVMGAFSPGFEGNFIGVAADVQIGGKGTTLADIASYIGLEPNTDISFAFQLSETSPCFALSIGNPDTQAAERAALRTNIANLQDKINAETNDLAKAAYQLELDHYQAELAREEAGKQASTAIDWFGVVEAQYVMVYWAPHGCQVATTPTLPSGTSGYAFDFDGSVFGTAVHIAGMFSAGITGTSGSLDVTVGEQGWSLAGIDAQPLTCTGPGKDNSGADNSACTEAHQVLPLFDLSFANKIYEKSFDLQFAGRINIWGAIMITASGNISSSLGANGGVVDVKLSASQNENLLGIFKENMSFSFDADWNVPPDQAPYFSLLDVDASAQAQVLVFSGAASFDFDYGPIIIDGQSQTVVNNMSGSFGVSLDLWILSAGVTASFSYTRPFQCQGSGGATAPVGNPPKCPTGEPAFCNDGATDCYEGDLALNISGTFSYWFFGEHTEKVDILATTIPIHFQKSSYGAPPPMQYAPKPPPQSEWPNPTWKFSTNMFLNVPWETTDLATAASGGLPGQPGSAPIQVHPDSLNFSAIGSSNPGSGGAGQPVPCPWDASKNCAPLAGAQTTTSFAPKPLYNPTGSATVGNTGGSGDTYSTATGTVPLLATPAYQQVVANYQAMYGPRRPLPANLTTAAQAACSGTAAAGKFSTDTPQWDGKVPASSSSKSFVVADLNWKMYLASVVELSSVSGDRGSSALKAAENFKCGYTNWDHFPALNDWLDQNSGGPQWNVAYPQSIANTTTEQQLCQAGSYPSGDFQAACGTNLSSLNSDPTTPWGSGWGG